MNAEIYKQLSALIDERIADTFIHFKVYTLSIKRKAKLLKESSYGGYDVLKITEDFKKEVNTKSNELLKEIGSLFCNSGRKLSDKQYSDLLSRCTELFTSIFDAFYKTLQDEFDLNGTIDSSLKVFRGNIALRISSHINALNIMMRTPHQKCTLTARRGA